MNEIDFESYFLGLSSEERESFATEVGTTVEYIRDHLISGRRFPRPKLIDALADALERRQAPVHREDLATFFYSRGKREAAA